MVSKGNRIYQMKEKVICYIMYMVAMDFFAASNSYDSLSVLFKFAVKSDRERVKNVITLKMFS